MKKLKILFVCSGNSKDYDIAPFIKVQGESLKKSKVEVDYYPIIGKGLWGYIKAGTRLRRFLKDKNYDVIHAHFSLSGWAAIIGSRNTPVVLSLMGDDAQGDHVGVDKITLKSRIFMFSTKLIQPFVDIIISKSQNLEKHVYLKHKSFLIPNGIDTDRFKPSTRIQKQELGLDSCQKYVLFLGNKSRIGKNFPLAQKAVSYLNLPDVELINPFPIPHNDIPKYLNAVNVLVVPSYMEGSPNVVKEAMACNCPIVATDVGDVKWVIGGTEGCFLSSFEITDFGEKIRLALDFSEKKGRTNGRQRIIQLGLDTNTIAKKLIDIYKHVI
ncbi:glycosyltransferase [Negadavirga shengliensis]|uniref:Glycosyltransferase n=1 Tax=Negadavirga shengliensis TaxID=1389218 RepID=A0ABV9T2D5_9BACT